MSENPFGDSGFNSAPQQQVSPQQGSGAGQKVIAFAIGAVLLIGGFVWKFFLGNAETGGSPEEASFMDFAWLIPVVVGGIVMAFTFKKKRQR